MTPPCPQSHTKNSRVDIYLKKKKYSSSTASLIPKHFHMCGTCFPFKNYFTEALPSVRDQK